MDSRLRMLLALIVGAAFVPACASTEPFISKETHGNLEVAVEWVGGDRTEDRPPAELLVDGMLLGHVSARRPVLHLREGEHEIEVRAKGYAPWTTTIFIAGEPNHQYLRVILRKVGGDTGG